jgi:hypothetical protein
VLAQPSNRPVGDVTTDGVVVRARGRLSGEAPSFRVIARSRPGSVEARETVVIERPAGAVNVSGGTEPSRRLPRRGAKTSAGC